MDVEQGNTPLPSMAPLQLPHVRNDSQNIITLPFFRPAERRVLLAVMDGAIVALWIVVAYNIWRAMGGSATGALTRIPLSWVGGGTALWLLISWLAGAYELDIAHRFSQALRVALTVAGIVTVVAVVSYFTFPGTYPRPAILLALAGSTVSLVLWRALYSVVLRRPMSATRLLVIGQPALFEVLSEAARTHEDYYRVIGFVGAKAVNHASCLGEVAHLLDICRRFRIHQIVVAPQTRLPHELVSLLSTCVERGIEVVEFTTAYEEIARKVAVEHAGDFWLAALPTRPHVSGAEEVAMRLLDIVGAVAGLLITTLLLPFLVVPLVLDSGFPILYKQERVGQGGKGFTMYKFRSMRTDAEKGGARWARPEDDRTTRVGRLLRKTHLDELPQFWNVLTGEMSLVGPRPERPEFTDELAQIIPFYRLRLSVRPGLTGQKQLLFGYASTPEEHLEVLRHDLYFIKHRSLVMNLAIIARTIGLVLGFEGR